ncbi:MAG: glycosyltransferase family 39 protein [Bacteroidales bacterium]|nr:glycosyltransferase family 39 protein [Bacteroidales bacterium]
MKKILLFSFFWLLINLVQSCFTEIIDDEAYYWVFSKFLDWGYCGHPPMIALMVKAGYVLFNNELGVRLLSSLMGAGTVFMILYMLKDSIRDLRLIILILFSIPFLHSHVAGFIAVPDVPMLFFSTLFFFFYKRYLSDDNLLHTLLLTLSIVLMLYSKYHALLIIGFTILSFPGLLQRRSFWLIVLFSILLYIPHILWEVRHDFMTFSYHLVERNRAFRIHHILDYFGGQILILGPFTGFLLLLSGIKKKAKDPYKRALKYNFAGIFLFFLASAIRGHVEAHWTAAGIIPMLLYTLPELEKKHPLVRMGYLLTGISIPLVVILRLLLVFDNELIPDHLRKRFHGKEEAMIAIDKRANGRPVVFTNSYQNSSVYWFFTQKPAFSYNNKHSHKSQFDLMGMESELQGKSVLFVPRKGFQECDTLKTGLNNYNIYDIEHYCTFNRVVVRPPDFNQPITAGSQTEITLELYNPTEDTVFFNDCCTFPSRMTYSYYVGDGFHDTRYDPEAPPLPDLPPGAVLKYSFQINIPDTPGKVRVMFSFGSTKITSGINGKPTKINVIRGRTQ